MARILIKNGTLITMDPRRRIIKDGAVAIENDKIADVGKTTALKDFQADKVFDAANRIVMPGLVDANIHNVQMLSRGIGDDVDLIAWCYDRIYPYEVILNRSDEYTYLSAALCCAERRQRPWTPSSRWVRSSWIRPRAASPAMTAKCVSAPRNSASSISS